MVEQASEKWFTTVSQFSKDKYYDSLLFYDSKKNGVLTRKEELIKILDSETITKTLGNSIEILRYECPDHDEILITCYIDKHPERLENAENEETLHLYSRGIGIRTINLKETYYQCSAMEKHVMGCEGCVRETKSPGCDIKNSFTNGIPPDIIGEAEIHGLRNRKTAINGFTFISPRLTRTEPFQKSGRVANEHDFTEIDHWSEVASRGSVEKARIDRFIKDSCSSCMAKEECHGPYSEFERAHFQYCKGAYPTTEDKAVKHLLDNYSIPYSDGELNELIDNLGSGEFRLKGNRFKVLLDFEVIKDELVFGWRYLTSPSGISRVDNIKNAVEMVIDTNNINPETPKIKITDECKALMICSGMIKHSPSSRQIWHKTKYPVLQKTIDSRCTSKPLVTFGFGYNTMKKKRGRYLPYTLEIKSLLEFMEFYSHIPGLPQTVGVLGSKDGHTSNRAAKAAFSAS